MCDPKCVHLPFLQLGSADWPWAARLPPDTHGTTLVLLDKDPFIISYDNMLAGHSRLLNKDPFIILMPPDHSRFLEEDPFTIFAAICLHSYPFGQGQCCSRKDIISPSQVASCSSK